MINQVIDIPSKGRFLKKTNFLPSKIRPQLSSSPLDKAVIQWMGGTCKLKGHTVGTDTSILSRTSENGYQQGFALTSIQVQVDHLLENFIHEASNPYTLTAMVAGGAAFRLGRMGALATGGRWLGASPGTFASYGLRGLSVGVGFGSEVMAFEGSHRALRVGLGGADASLLAWSGENGLKRGLVSSALTLGALKVGGHISRDQNIVLQHLFADTAMVAAHQVSAAFGMTPRPTGNLAEQYLHAEATNLQMQVGMRLVHNVAPRLAAAERNLDLSLKSQEMALRRPSLPVLQPAFATAENGRVRAEISSAAPTSKGPLVLQMAAIGDGRSGKGAGSGSVGTGGSKLPGEERMQTAYELGAALVRDKLATEDPAGLALLTGMRASDLVVVEGDYDHIHVMLDRAEIPYTLTSRDRVTPDLLAAARAVFVNCCSSFPLEAAERLALFVEQGGLLLTTDWALRSVIEVAFPGLILHNGRYTGDEVVAISAKNQDDPLVGGFFRDNADPAWWLESQSYPFRILDRSRVQVIVDSARLRKDHGNGSVVVRFRHGKGGVYHLISHLYLQRFEHQHVRHAGKSTVLAQSMGASGMTVGLFEAAEAANPKLDFGTVQAAATSVRLVTGALIDFARSRATGSELFGVSEELAQPLVARPRGPAVLGWTPQSPNWAWDTEAHAYRFRMPPGKNEVVIGRNAAQADEVILEPHVSRQHLRIERFPQGATGYLLTVLSQTNPVKVNDGPELKAGQTAAIRPGDKIKIFGDVEFIFDPVVP